MFFTRQETSKQRLTIQWDYPEILEVRKGELGDGETASVTQMRALERVQAMAKVAGDDLRPLLVLRECETCKGTDDALLNDRLNSELTALYARWFHCVRLPTAVLKADHTFHNLFEGDVAPHMFVCSVDGTNLVPLPGRPSQSQLWEAMLGVLELEYERDAERAAKEIYKLLAKYDHYDSMEEEYQNQISREIEKRGSGTSKLRQLERKLARIRKEREEAIERERKIADLRLKRAGGSTSDGSGG